MTVQDVIDVMSPYDILEIRSNTTHDLLETTFSKIDEDPVPRNSMYADRSVYRISPLSSTRIIIFINE